MRDLLDFLNGLVDDPDESWLCPDCGDAKHEHERPYGCSRCGCENGYWGGDDE